MHILFEIGRSKNVSQSFGICIPLAIRMHIEIALDQQIANIRTERANKFRTFREEISIFQSIFLSYVVYVCNGSNNELTFWKK